jgi:hypothetical protein
MVESDPDSLSVHDTEFMAEYLVTETGLKILRRHMERSTSHDLVLPYTVSFFPEKDNSINSSGFVKYATLKFCESGIPEPTNLESLF